MGIPSNIEGMPLLLNLNLHFHYSLSSDLKPQTSPLIAPFFVVTIKSNRQGGHKLAKSNQKFNKRRKEIARKEKKELKRQRKLNKSIIKSDEDSNQSRNEGENI